jgi:hypothetical protein
MVCDKLLGIPTQCMVEIVPEVLDDAFRIHTQGRQIIPDRQGVLNKKRLGVNDFLL